MRHAIEVISSGMLCANKPYDNVSGAEVTSRVLSLRLDSLKC
jgi:hypothetical protein